MAIQIDGIVQNRRATADEYTAVNPTLIDGELAYESDTLKSKWGDGVTDWNNLDYASSGSGSGSTAPNALSLQKQTGILIPLYVYPADIYNDTTVYGKVFDVARKNKEIPIIIIMNVNNGPGTAYDANWAGAIKKSVGAGVIPVGYVYSLYGLRPIAEAKADIDKWIELYPEIQGIFVDEQWWDDDERVDWYREVVEYANNLGLSITIGNPGDQSHNVYSEIFDIVVCWETDAVGPSQSVMEGNWIGGATEVSLFKRGYMKIGAATYDAAFHTEVCKWYGFIYVTSDIMSPNPWDSLSSYMDNMVTTILNQ